MRSTMLKVFVAAVAIAAAIESAFATSAKSYIQDGLVLHLDAIANNGVDANGADVHAALSGANCWKELVNDMYMKRTASKNVTWGAKYVDFAGDVAHTNRFPAVLQALRSRSLTAEIFLMPKTYKKWGGYLHLGDNGNHRYLTIEMGEDASTSPSYKGAFHRVQAYDSTWGNHSDIIIQTNTQYYFNKNVHVALTVDGAGSHLAFDDGPIIHTNPVGSLMPTFDVVKIGGYSTYPAAARYYAFRIYNRVLEDWEFKYNRELDKVRFLDAANVVMKILGLTAAGDVATHCEAYSGADGDAVTFTNSNLSSPSNTCTVVGYSHYDENGDLIASGSGGSYSCTLSKSTMLCSRLEWNVAVSNLLTVAAQGSGSVSAASGFRDAAVDAVLTAVPDAGSRFVRWEGSMLPVLN